MKIGWQHSLVLSIWLIFVISCRKHEEMVADCISGVTADSASMANQVTSSQLAVIANLFSSNSLSTAGEQFYALDSNRILPLGYTDSVSQVAVGAYRWFNHLPVFMRTDYFLFYNGALQSAISSYQLPAPGPDTSFHQSLESLRRIYQANLSPRYLDSCLTAQPGYIDLSYFNLATTYGIRLIKAWKVTPVGSSFPMVFIADSTGAAWPVSLSPP